MRIIIFSNGNFEHAKLDRDRIKKDDLLIAANGGVHHCLALGLKPDLLVGDLDSVENSLVEDLKARGTIIQEHPARKDHTDLELAIELAVERNPAEILILGGLGGRWDQTLANILLLTQDRFRGPQIKLVDGLQQIELIPAGKTLQISASPGSIISLIPIKGDAQGITTEGLEYELSDGELRYGSTRGVSNVLVQETAHVSLAKGMLICIIFENGFAAPAA